MPARYLIAIGSPRCDGMGLPELKRVESDVRRVVEFFAGPEQGYERVLADEIPPGATARQIKDALADWFADPARKAADCVVVYYAGHGDEVGKFGHHYLFASDSTERQLFRNAIKTKDLVEIFFEGEGERPQNVLLILDTCYSGQGGNQAAAAVAQAKQATLRSGSGLWALASADSLTEAADGAFVNAMLSVLNNDAWLPRGGKQFLNPLELRDGVNEWFERNRHPQRAVADVIGSESQATFIRNPRYTRQLDGLELADRAHWDPKARGVEGLTSPGWFFTGRENARRELAQWLKAETSDLKARVVTGRPGSGKSAVLGWLVTCSHPETRRQMQKDGALGNNLALAPDVGLIDAVLYAHGATLSGMVSRLAEQLRIEDSTLEGLLKELARRKNPARILVNALDEADNPLELETELLSKLAVCPSARLIVGTRKRNEVVPLAGLNEVIDLDAEEYFSESDLADYVTARLIWREPPTVYADPARHADAERIGRAVARKADRSFLYARIVSRWLAGAGAPLDTTRQGWERQLDLPEDLTQAFGQDLSRFPDETRRRFFDLLVPLAYARGKGLPQKNIWRALATRIAGRDYHNGDIRELKEQAGYYLTQDTERGDTVYRLFHQTFADYLKERTRDEDVERVIADTLIELATPPNATTPAWDQLREPYLLRSLPGHAAGGRKLDELVTDPEFLLAMPPETLLPELFRLSPVTRKIAATYRKASHLLRATEKQSKLPYLLLSALQEGAGELAEGLRKLKGAGRWSLESVWWWRRATPSEVAVTTDDRISTFVIAESDHGQPVAVIGGYDWDVGGGAVSVWDLGSGRKLAQSGRFKTRIPCLVVTRDRGGQIVVSGCEDGAIRIFALASGALLQEKEGAHQRSDASDFPAHVNDLCVIRRDGQTVLASAGDDKALRLWSLPELHLLDERLNAHDNMVVYLASTKLGETEALISSCNWVLDHCLAPPPTARLWNVKDLSLLREIPLEGNLDGELKVFEFARRQVLLLESKRNKLELWDLETGTKLAIAPFGLSCISIVDWQGEPLITGIDYGEFRRLKIEPAKHATGGLPYELRAVGEPVKLEGVSWVGAEWKPPFEFSGRQVFASDSLDKFKIRIWDVAELMEDGPIIEGGRLWSMATDSSSPNLIVTLSSPNWGVEGKDSVQVRAWDWRTAEQKWAHEFSDHPISCLAVARTDSRSFLVAAASPSFLMGGDFEGSLLIYDLSLGRRLREPIRVGTDIKALTAFMMDGALYCAAVVGLKREDKHKVYRRNAVRIWNLDTGGEYETRLRNKDGNWLPGSPEYTEWAMTFPSEYPYDEDSCVAVDYLEDEPVVVAGGLKGKIYCMEPAHPEDRIHLHGHGKRPKPDYGRDPGTKSRLIRPEQWPAGPDGFGERENPSINSRRACV